MGYDVAYQFSLSADKEEVKQVLYYSRGRCGWDGDAPPAGHRAAETEGLREERVGGAEWRITIADGRVKMDFFSKKFYDHYMTRMLKLLKERVPSLRGHVSCDLGLYWTVDDKVVCGDQVSDLLTSKARGKQTKGTKGISKPRGKQKKAPMSVDALLQMVYF